MWTVELNFVEGAEVKAMCVPFNFYGDALAYANLADHIFQTPGKRVKLRENEDKRDRSSNGTSWSYKA